MNTEETILIVDDDHGSLNLLTGMLSGAGYQVRSADRGELALASATSAPPDLIMLDVRMPDMDGIEVFRRLKTHPQTADVPVMLMSAAAEAPEKVEGLDLGAMDYIAKPFESRELLARVQNRLELVSLRHEVQRKAAELSHTSEVLLNTLKSIGDAVISTDEQGRVLHGNPMAEQLTGWPESEAKGNPLDQVYHIVNEQTRQPVENTVVKVLREGVVFGLANRLLELRPAIKRLFISGFTADVIAQRGILDDGVNLLSKPFGRDALALKVREVLGASHAPAFAVTETP